MFAPIANNIIVIAMAIGFLAFAGSDTTVNSITNAQLTWLGLGTTLGVVVQALLLLPVLGRVGFRYRPRFDFRGSGLGRTAVLAGWTVAMVLANQLALLVTTRLATSANLLASQQGTVPQGLMTFDKAYLVFNLPNSVITISIVTALLPRMSHSATEGKPRRRRSVGGWCPTGVGADRAGSRRAHRLRAIADDACVQLRRRFRRRRHLHRPGGLGLRALGQVPFALFYLLIRGWYSLSDTRSPFVVTVVFSLLLVGFRCSSAWPAPAPRCSAWRWQSRPPTGSRWWSRGCGCPVASAVWIPVPSQAAWPACCWPGRLRPGPDSRSSPGSGTSSHRHPASNRGSVWRECHWLPW